MENNIISAIERAIGDEMEEYALELQKELVEKYTTEFEERLKEHRRKVVLDVCEKIKIVHQYDPEKMLNNITIKL